MNHVCKTFFAWTKAGAFGLLLAILSLVSPQLAMAALTVDTTVWNAPNGGGTKTVAVTSDAAWTVTSDQPWLTFDKTSGTGNDSVTLTVAANAGIPGRSANVIFRSGSAMRLIKLNQIQPGRVASWGNNDYGQCTSPSGLFDVIAVANGDHCTVALKSDGTVVAWGVNWNGESYNVPLGLTNVVSVAIGPDPAQMVALKSNGTLVAWGGDNGQPVIPSGLSDIVAVTLGLSHTVALKSDGTVAVYGKNDNGQCDVPVGLSDVVNIAAGTGHTVALKSDGTVVAWGNNLFGQCTIPAGLTRVVAIAAGSYHTVALKSDGTIVAWGANWSGQCSFPADLSDVVAVTSGHAALKSDGTVVAWNSDVDSQNVIPSGLTGVVAITTGASHTTCISTQTCVVAASVDPELGGIVTGGGEFVSGASHTIMAIANPGYCFTGWTERGMPVASVPIYTFCVTANRNLVANFFKLGLNKAFWLAPTSGGSLDVTITTDSTWTVTSDQPWLVLDKGSGTGNGTVSLAAAANPGVTGRSGTVIFRSGSAMRMVKVNQIQPGYVGTLGNNNYGQCTVPLGLSDVVNVSAGGNQTVALKADGTVVAWGGDGCTPPAGLSDVVSVSAGTWHTLALKSNGTVVGWGSNQNGRCTPPIGLSDVVAVSAGFWHSLALKSDGTVVAWGGNGDGQCTLPIGLSDVVAVSAGWSDSVALKADGTVVSWGEGRSVVPGNISGIVALATCDSSYVMALKSNGTVVDWGYSQCIMPDGLFDIAGVSVGRDYRMVLKSNGTVVAWGQNDFGQSSTDNLREVAAIDAGDYHSVCISSKLYDVAVSANSDVGGSVAGGGKSLAGTFRTVTAIANADYSFVGWTENGTILASTSIYAVPVTANRNLVANFVRLAVDRNVWNAPNNGGAVDLAVGTDGDWTVTVDQPWLTFDKTSGTGNTTVTLTAATNAGMTGRSANVIFHSSSAIRLVKVNQIQPGYVGTWGSNISGQCNVPPGLSGVLAVAAGNTHTLALKSDGTVVAWGNNLSGQCTTPIGLANVVAISAGRNHSLALKSDGTVLAWGYTGDGLCDVPVGLSGVVDISANDGCSLALKSDGTVVAWGSNVYSVPADLSGVVAIAAGPYHSLALRSDGTVVAWGATWDDRCNVPSGLSGVAVVSAGDSHSVALKSDKTVMAWGNNFDGQCTIPVDLSGVEAVAAGGRHSVGLKSDGTVAAWGLNENGQCNVPASLSGVASVAGGGGHTVCISNQPSSIAVVASPDAGGSIEGGGIFVPGTSCAVKASSKVGYCFADWTENGSVVSTSPSYSFTVAGNRNLVANFVRFAVDRNVWNAPNGGGTIDLAVNTEAAWTVSCDQPWLSFDKTSGTGNATVTLTAVANAGVTGRSATVVFHCGSEIRLVKVNQIQPGYVGAWGNNVSGQCNVPAGLADAVAVAGGVETGQHTIALKSDGTVVAWGLNTSGQCTVPAGLSGVVAIAAGYAHTVVLKADGTVVAWGSNGSGQCTVPSGLSGVVAIAAGSSYSVVLKADGTVVAWGYNDYGQCTVPSGLSGVMAVAAGSSHSLALKADGTLVAWGSNGSGQCTVPAGLSGVVAIAAGSSHSLALKADGTVVAWGNNNYGQSTVPAGLSGVVSVAEGIYHTVALKSDGTVVGWGTNASGQTTVPTGLSEVAAVATGGSHIICITSRTCNVILSAIPDAGGTVSGGGAFVAGKSCTVKAVSNAGYCFANWTEAGTVVSDSPTYSFAVEGNRNLVANFVRFSIDRNVWNAPNGGGSIDLAVGADAAWTVSCDQPWLTFDKTFGTGDATVTLTASANSGATGRSATLIFHVGDAIRLVKVSQIQPGYVGAWGSNSSGQCTVPASLSDAVSVVAGGAHTVALKSDGTVVAWGNNSYSQCTIPSGLSGVVSIAVGGAHTVALKSDGTVVAWGSNNYGQSTVPAGLSGVVSVAANNLHSMALKSDGTVIAWGYNNFGQCTVPIDLSGVVSVSAGGSYSVALKSDGTLVVWGSNSSGQCTIPAGLSGVVSVSAGSSHVVALKSDGTIAAWGDNYSGQCTIPTDLSGVVGIAAGISYTVALKSDGMLVAWGSNTSGQATIPAGVSEVASIAAGNSHAVRISNKTYMIAANAIPEAGGTASGGGTFVPGVSCTLKALSNSGYCFAGWTENGVIVSSAQTYTFTVSDNRTLVANFVLFAVDRNVWNSPNEGGTIDLAVSTQAAWTVTCDQAWLAFDKASGTGNDTVRLTVAANAGIVGRSATVVFHAGSAIRMVKVNQIQPGYVVAWGSNAIGQCDVPVGLAGIVSIAGGDGHSVALKSDGTVVAWGGNGSGQCNVPAGLSNVVAVAAGNVNTMALKSDGTVVAWGANAYGQCSVPAGLSDVVAISSGWKHVLVLKADGTVVAWGSNASGQCNVPSGLANVVAVEAGDSHSTALKYDGTVATWGSPAYNVLSVPAGLANVVAISGGNIHTAALKSDGMVVAWGDNSYGQRTIPSGLADVVAISATNGNHTAALKSDGTIALWGKNTSGECAVPSGLSGKAAMVVAGESHNLAITSQAYMVTLNSSPNEGGSVTGGGLTPAGTVSTVTAAASHGYCFAGWIENGSVVGQDLSYTFSVNSDRCFVAKFIRFEVDRNVWNAPNDGGTLNLHIDAESSWTVACEQPWLTFDQAFGNGDATVVMTAAGNIGPISRSATVIFRSGNVINLVKVKQVQPGRVLAWGSNSSDQCAVPSGLLGVVGVVAGGSYTTALKSDGTVVSWGSNQNPNGLSGVVALAAGGYHAMALKSDGTIVAWGEEGRADTFGQCEIPSSLFDVVEIAAGIYHSVSLKSDGRISSWGLNNYNQATVPSELTNVIAVSAGGYHTVALKSDGTVAAWGANSNGQCSLPSGLSGVVAVAAGGYHTVALKSDGTVVAWGANNYGQATVPTDLLGVVAIAAGFNHTMAMKSDGTVVLWGSNSAGQCNFPLEIIFAQAISAGANHSLSIAPYLQASPLAWVALGHGDSQEVAVSSSSAWTCKTDQPWLTLDKMSGIGDGTVTLSAVDNPTDSARTATVTFKAAGVADQVVTVTQAAKPTLAVSPATWSVGKSEETQAMTVTSNTSWTVSSDQAWLTLDLAEGTGDGTVTLTDSANPTISERSATVTFKAVGCADVTVVVTQVAGDPALAVSPGTWTPAKTGGTQEVAVVSNTDWTASSDQGWLTMDKASGSSDGPVTLAAVANPTISERSATVTFKAAGCVDVTVVVTQAAGDPTLSVSPATWAASKAGGTQNVSVTSNTTWTAASDQGWLTLDQTGATGDGTLTLTAEANPTISDRTATVTFKAAGCVDVTVVVTQAAGDPTLSVSPGTWAAPKASGTQNVSVTSNSSWTAASDQGWLALDQAGAIGDGTLTLSAEANPTISERTATVTFKVAGVADQVVTVTQAAGDPALSVASASWAAAKTSDFKEIALHSNTAWTASSDQPWLKVVPEGGNGDAMVAFAIEANPTIAERMATVTFKAAGCTDVTIVVTQAAGDPALAVSPGTWAPEKTGGTQAVAVASNASWTASSDRAWLTLDLAEGTGDGAVTLTASTNPTISERLATVTFQAAGCTDVTIVVTQAAGDPVLEVTPSLFNINKFGGVRTVTVTSNQPWTAVSNQAWLSPDKVSGDGSAALVLSVAANSTLTNRTATVTVKAGALVKTVSVTQASDQGDIYEPNNFPEFATPGLFANLGGLADVTQAISDATIHNIATGDYYKLEATVPGTLVVTLDNLPSNYGAYLYVLDSSTSSWKSVAGTSVAGAVPKAFSKVLAPGTYVVRVAAGSVAVASPLPYRLTLGWTFTRTISATPGSWTAPKGGGTQEFAISSNTGWTASSNSSWLKLDKASGNGNGTLTMTAMQNETTVLRTAIVTLTAGSVVKRLTVTQPSMADRYEPNNTLDTATTGLFSTLGGMADGTKVVADVNIHSLNTGDYYRFEATQAGTMTATLDNLPSNYGAYLYQYDPGSLSWKLLKATSVSGAVPKSLSAAISTGIYALRVAAGTGAVAAPSPYRLTVVWDGPQDRYEPNNSLDTATAGLFPSIGGAASASKTLSDATIHTINTGDYYKFEATVSGSLTATLDKLPSNYGAYLYGYDAATSAWKLLKITSVSGAVPKSLTASLSPGIYAVRVAAGTGGVASATPYQLTLAWVAAGPLLAPMRVAEPFLEVSASAESIAPGGGTVELDIVANGSWTVAADSPRAVVGQASGSGSGRVTLAIGPRAGDTSEIIAIKVVGTGGLVRTIQIVQ